MSRTLALSVLVAFAACSRGGEPASAAAGAPGSAAPVEVVDLAGLERALAARKGHGYLLNFWALWCEPCVEEMPELGETAHAWRERGGAVVTVSYDLVLPDVTPQAAREQVLAFRADKGMDLPVYVLQGADLDAINARFDLPGPIPVTLAIDREGRIVDREEGQASRERFEALMAAALR